MTDTLELYGSNGVNKIGIKFTNPKPAVFLFIGIAIGALAVNYINNQKRHYKLESGL